MIWPFLPPQPSRYSAAKCPASNAVCSSVPARSADLKPVVFGQDSAIEAIASAIKLARAGLREPEKPVGSYLFSGPTGVGKTEVARQLALVTGGV